MFNNNYDDELQIYQDLLYVVNNIKKYKYFDIIEENLYLPEFVLSYDDKTYRKAKENIKGFSKKDVLLSLVKYLKLLDEFYLDVKYKNYISQKDNQKYKNLIIKNKELIHEIESEIDIGKGYGGSITKTSLMNIINKVDNTINRIILYRNNVVKYLNKNIIFLDNEINKIKDNNKKNNLKNKYSQMLLLKNYFDRHDIKEDIQSTFEKAIYDYISERDIDELYLRSIVNNMIKVSYINDSYIIKYASRFLTLREKIEDLLKQARQNYEDVFELKIHHYDEYDKEVLDFLEKSISEKIDILKEKEEEIKLDEEKEKRDLIRQKDKIKIDNIKEDIKNIDISKNVKDIEEEVSKIEKEEYSIQKKIRELINAQEEKKEEEENIINKLRDYLSETFTKEYKSSNTIRSIYDNKIKEYKEKYLKLDIKNDEIDKLLNKYENMKKMIDYKIKEKKDESIKEINKETDNLQKNIQKTVIDEKIKKEKLLSDEAYKKTREYVDNSISMLDTKINIKENIDIYKIYKNFCMSKYINVSILDIDVNKLLEAYTRVALVEYYNNLINLFDAIYVRMIDGQHKITTTLDKKIKEIIHYITLIN